MASDADIQAKYFAAMEALVSLSAGLMASFADHGPLEGFRGRLRYAYMRRCLPLVSQTQDERDISDALLESRRILVEIIESVSVEDEDRERTLAALDKLRAVYARGYST